MCPDLSQPARPRDGEVLPRVAGREPTGFKGLADDTEATHFARYTLFNDDSIREQVIESAAARYDYKTSQVRLALCIGKFALKDGSGEKAIRAHLGAMKAGGGPV